MHRRNLFFLILLPAIAFGQVSVQWHKTFKNGIQSINSAVSLKTDKWGNIFVLGTTHEPDSVKKIMLFKFDSSGTEQWRRIHRAQAGTDEVAVGMALDHEGNTVITGTVKNESGNTDIITLKYSTDGILDWENIYAGKANLFDAPKRMAIDRKGNVFVCGYETAGEANPDLLLLRYQASGELSYVRNYSSPQMDIAVDVAVDDSCNAYVCGNINVDTHSADILLIKFDSTGNTKWQYAYDGPEGTVDVATEIALDDSTNIFITGSANHANDKSDVPLIKFNRNGKLIHEQHIGEGVADGIGSALVTGDKTVFVQTAFTDFLQQTVTISIYMADKSCQEKFRFRPSSEDITYLKAAPWRNNSTLLFGSILSRPENTIAPYIGIADSSNQVNYEFHDDVFTSLLHIKDVLLSGREIYFLGDDATENAGTISVVKYALPDMPKSRPGTTKPKAK